MKSFENDDSMDGARHSIIIAYTLYKAINTAYPAGVVVYLNTIRRFLSNLKIDKQQSLTTLCFIGLFSKVMKGSTYVTQLIEKADNKYNEIKQLIL